MKVTLQKCASSKSKSKSRTSASSRSSRCKIDTTDTSRRASPMCGENINHFGHFPSSNIFRPSANDSQLRSSSGEDYRHGVERDREGREEEGFRHPPRVRASQHGVERDREGREEEGVRHPPRVRASQHGVERDREGREEGGFRHPPRVREHGNPQRSRETSSQSHPYSQTLSRYPPVDSNSSRYSWHTDNNGNSSQLSSQTRNHGNSYQHSSHTGNHDNSYQHSSHTGNNGNRLPFRDGERKNFHDLSERGFDSNRCSSRMSPPPVVSCGIPPLKDSRYVQNFNKQASSNPSRKTNYRHTSPSRMFDLYSTNNCDDIEERAMMFRDDKSHRNTMATRKKGYVPSVSTKRLSNTPNTSSPQNMNHRVPQIPPPSHHKTPGTISCNQSMKPFVEFSGCSNKYLTRSRSLSCTKVKMIKNKDIEIVEVIPAVQTHDQSFPNVKSRSVSKCRRLSGRRVDKDSECLIVDLTRDTNPEESDDEVVTISSDSDLHGESLGGNSSRVRDLQCPFTKYSHPPSEIMYNKRKHKPVKRLKQCPHRAKNHISRQPTTPVDDSSFPLDGGRDFTSGNIFSPSLPTAVNDPQQRKSKKSIISSHVSTPHPSENIVNPLQYSPVTNVHPTRYSSPTNVHSLRYSPTNIVHSSHSTLPASCPTHSPTKNTRKRREIPQFTELRNSELNLESSDGDGGLNIVSSDDGGFNLVASDDGGREVSDLTCTISPAPSQVHTRILPTDSPSNFVDTGSLLPHTPTYYKKGITQTLPRTPTYSKKGKLKLNRKATKMSKPKLVDVGEACESFNSSHREKDLSESEASQISDVATETSDRFPYLTGVSSPWSERKLSVKIFKRPVKKKQLVDSGVDAMRPEDLEENTSATFPLLYNVLNKSVKGYPPRNLLNPLVTPLVVLNLMSARKLTYRLGSVKRKKQEEKQHLKRLEKWKNGFVGVEEDEDSQLEKVHHHHQDQDHHHHHQEKLHHHHHQDYRKHHQEHLHHNEDKDIHQEQNKRNIPLSKTTEQYQSKSYKPKELVENKPIGKPEELLDMPIICPDTSHKVKHSKENFSFQNKKPSGNISSDLDTSTLQVSMDIDPTIPQVAMVTEPCIPQVSMETKPSIPQVGMVTEPCIPQEPSIPQVTDPSIPVPGKRRRGRKKKQARKTLPVREAVCVGRPLTPSQVLASGNLPGVCGDVPGNGEVPPKTCLGSTSYTISESLPSTSTPKIFHSSHQNVTEPGLSGISEGEEGDTDYSQVQQDGQRGEKLSPISEEDMAHPPGDNKDPKVRHSDSRLDGTLTSEEDLSLTNNVSSFSLSSLESSLTHFFDKSSQDTVRKAADSTSDVLYRQREARKAESINSMVEEYLEKLVRDPGSCLKAAYPENSFIPDDSDFISSHDISVQECAKDFFKLCGPDVARQQDVSYSDQITRLTQNNLNMLVEISALWMEIQNGGDGQSSPLESMFGDIPSSPEKESELEPLKDSPDSPDELPLPQGDPEDGAGFLEEDLRINSSSFDSQESFVADPLPVLVEGSLEELMQIVVPEEHEGLLREDGEITPVITLYRGEGTESSLVEVGGVCKGDSPEDQIQIDSLERIEEERSEGIRKHDSRPSECGYEKREMGESLVTSRCDWEEEERTQDNVVERSASLMEPTDKVPPQYIECQHSPSLPEPERKDSHVGEDHQHSPNTRLESQTDGSPTTRSGNKTESQTDRSPTTTPGNKTDRSSTTTPGNQTESQTDGSPTTRSGNKTDRSSTTTPGNQTESQTVLQTDGSSSTLGYKSQTERSSNKKGSPQQDAPLINKGPRKRLSRHRLAECVPLSEREEKNLTDSSRMKYPISSPSGVPGSSLNKNLHQDSPDLKDSPGPGEKSSYSNSKPTTNHSESSVRRDASSYRDLTESKPETGNSLNETSLNETTLLKSDEEKATQDDTKFTTTNPDEQSANPDDLPNDSVMDQSPEPSVEAPVASSAWKQIFQDKAVVMVEPLKKKIKSNGSLYRKKADVWKVRSEEKNLFPCPESSKRAEEISRMVEARRQDCSKQNIESADQSTKMINQGGHLKMLIKPAPLSKRDTGKKLKRVQISRNCLGDIDEPKGDAPANTKKCLELINKHPAMKMPVSRLAQNILRKKALEEQAANQKKKNEIQPLESFEEIIRKTKKPNPHSSDNSDSKPHNKSSSFTIPKLCKDAKAAAISGQEDNDGSLVSPLTKRYTENDSRPSLQFNNNKSPGLLSPNPPSRSGFVFGVTQFSSSPFAKRKTFEDCRRSEFLSPRFPEQSPFVFGETQLSFSPFGKRKMFEDRTKGFSFGQSFYSNTDQSIKKDLLKKLESVLPRESESSCRDTREISPTAGKSDPSDSFVCDGEEELNYEDEDSVGSEVDEDDINKEGDDTADLDTTETRSEQPSLEEQLSEKLKVLRKTSDSLRESERKLEGSKYLPECVLVGDELLPSPSGVSGDCNEDVPSPSGVSGDCYEDELSPLPSGGASDGDEKLSMSGSGRETDKQRACEQTNSKSLQEDGTKTLTEPSHCSKADLEEEKSHVECQSRGEDRTENNPMDNLDINEIPPYSEIKNNSELSSGSVVEESSNSVLSRHQQKSLADSAVDLGEDLDREESPCPEHKQEEKPSDSDGSQMDRLEENLSESEATVVEGGDTGDDLGSPESVVIEDADCSPESVVIEEGEPGDGRNRPGEPVPERCERDSKHDPNSPLLIELSDERSLHGSQGSDWSGSSPGVPDGQEVVGKRDDEDSKYPVDSDGTDGGANDADNDRVVDDEEDKTDNKADDDVETEEEDKAEEDDDVLSLLPSDDEFMDEFEMESVRPVTRKQAPITEDVKEKVCEDLGEESSGSKVGGRATCGESSRPKVGKSGPKVGHDGLSGKSSGAKVGVDGPHGESSGAKGAGEDLHGESSGVKFGGDGPCGESSCPKIRKWLVPLNYCFDFVLTSNCKRKDCSYIHTMPKPELICSQAAFQIHHMLNTNRSKDAVDMYIGIHQLQLNCSLRPLDKFIKSLLDACFVVGFSYANVAYNLLCVLYSQQRDAIDARTCCEFLKLCGTNRLANFMLLSNAFNMMKSLNLQPTSVDGLITLLMLFYELKKYKEVFEVMIYCNECEVPCVPLFVRVTVLKQALQSPNLFIDSTNTWIDQTHEHLLLDLDRDLLAHLLLIFKNKQSDSVVQKLEWVLQVKAQATIPEIQEPDTDREEAETMATSQFESREEQMNEKLSYLHRIQGCKSSCNWEYLADIYLDLCSRQWPKNSDYLERYVDTITAHKTKIVEAFRQFVSYIGGLVDRERIENVFFEFDEKSLSYIGSGILHECCVKDLYSEGADILNLMLSWKLRVCETRSRDIHGSVQNVLIICSHSNHPRLAAQVLEDLQWLKYNPSPVTNVNLYIEHLNKLVKCLVGRVECKTAFDVLNFFVTILQRSGTDVDSLDCFHDHFPEIVNRCLTFGLLHIGLSTFKLHKSICQSKKIFHQSTLRSLFAACYEINDMIGAEEVYAYNYSSFYRKYVQQNLHESKAKRVKLSALLCLGEMVFILREYLSCLCGYLCKRLDDGASVVTDDLTVVVEFVCDGDIAVRSLPYLSSIPQSDYSAGELLRLALATLKPPILTKIIPGTNKHELSKTHLRDYLRFIDSKERKGSLRFDTQRRDQTGGFIVNSRGGFIERDRPSLPHPPRSLPHPRTKKHPSRPWSKSFIN